MGRYVDSARSITLGAVPIWLYLKAVLNQLQAFDLTIYLLYIVCVRGRQKYPPSHRMSANNDNSDPSYRVPFLSSLSRRTTTPGMDLPPSRYSPQSQFNEPIPNSSSMSTLTMRPSVLPSPRHLLWEDTRSLELPSRPRSPTERTEKVELPSIRQVCAPTGITKGRILTCSRRSRKFSSSRAEEQKRNIELILFPTLHQLARAL